MHTFVTTSLVTASAEAVWQRITIPEGINDELMPIMRMTVPATANGLNLTNVTPNTKLGRSWLLLFGLLPIDYDDIGIAEFEPGRRFLEQSTMLSMQTWRHERTLTPRGDTCMVSDRITFELRAPLAWIPGLSVGIEVCLRVLFRHRHRRLGAWFR